MEVEIVLSREEVTILLCKEITQIIKSQQSHHNKMDKIMVKMEQTKEMINQISFKNMTQNIQMMIKMVKILLIPKIRIIKKVDYLKNNNLLIN